MNNKTRLFRMDKYIKILIIFFSLGFIITSCNLLVKMEKSDSVEYYDLTTEEGITGALSDAAYMEKRLDDWYRHLPPKVSNPACGDVNYDGVVDFIDAIMVSYYYVDIGIYRFDINVADVDYTNPSNTGIDIVDAFLIAKYSGNLITALPWPSSL